MIAGNSYVHANKFTHHLLHQTEIYDIKVQGKNKRTTSLKVKFHFENFTAQPLYLEELSKQYSNSQALRASTSGS